jgi:hypothetical protein
MSAITDILDRLSGVAILKERLAHTSRNIDRTLGWLLDHEKRLIRIEADRGSNPSPKSRLPRAVRSKK